MIAIPIPDKWIRKMVIQAIAAVDPSIPVYDSRTRNDFPATYVLLSTQNNVADPASKCGERWLHTLQIDVFTRYPSAGNPADRSAAEDLAEIVRAALQNPTIDPASGLNLLRWDVQMPFDQVIDDGSHMIVQKVLRFGCVIN